MQFSSVRHNQPLVVLTKILTVFHLPSIFYDEILEGSFKEILRVVTYGKGQDKSEYVDQRKKD